LGDSDIHAILDANAEKEANYRKLGHLIDENSSPISMLSKDKLTPEHLEKIKKSSSIFAPSHTGESEEEHQQRMVLGINHGDSDKEINKKLTNALNLPDTKENEQIKESAISHKNATPDHINQVLSSSDLSDTNTRRHHRRMIDAAIGHPNVTMGNIKTATTHGMSPDDIVKSTNASKVLARQPNLADSNIEKILQYHKRNGGINLDLIKHQNLRDSHISDIINSTGESFYSPSEEIYQALLDNPKLKAKHIENIALRTNKTQIQKKIVGHPNTNLDALTGVAGNIVDPEVAERMLDHPIMNGSTEQHKKTLSKLALRMEYGRIDNHMLFTKMLNHPAVTSKTLASIANATNDPELHKAIVNNPNTAIGALNSIADKTNDPEVQKAINSKYKDMANDGNTSNTNLLQIAYRTNDPEIHKAILNRPHLSYGTINGIADNTNDPEVLKAIINHPNTSAYTKNRLIDKLGKENPYLS
jgi:hypothetical protein